MSTHTLSKARLLCIFMFITISATAQVRIGPDVKKEPHHSAVLELDSKKGGLLLPRMSNEQMLAITDPADALLLYNSDARTLFIYNLPRKQWEPLLMQTGREGYDSCEWEYDSTTARVYLTRGLPASDTIFYSPVTRKFVFSDRFTNTNSIGDDFPADAFNAKYTFKSTASQRDTSLWDGSTVNVMYEADESSLNTFFPALNVAAVANPKRTSVTNQLVGITSSAIQAGQDTALTVFGISSSASVSGNGYTQILAGYSGNTRFNPTSNNDVLLMYGIRNTLSRPPAISSKVQGNLYGYFGAMTGFDSSVTGNAYGVFLADVRGAAPKRNYAFYSNRGHNRFGDSVLVTDVFANSPRAVFDINSTSAMIIPSGSTFQRPATAVTGMYRFNTQSKGPEYFNGTDWKTLSADSAEWSFNPATSRVSLTRGLPKDTIFYNPQTRKFVFSDRYTNTNSLGQDFPVDAFNAKYTFKSTASQRTDSTLLDGSVMNVVYEVDNASSGTIFQTLSTTAVINPKSFQKSDILTGITNTAIHAGNDSLQVLFGITNSVRNSGSGRTGIITGIQNQVGINNGSNDNAGEIVGIRNSIFRNATTTGRVTGNIYGWLGTISGFTGNVDGSIYGVFLGNVSGAGPKRNFAFYSSKGLNRLGDSTLITDGNAITPRAVLDVNATSAMIVPTGTTAQRPTAAVTGMVRYNTTQQTLEAYNGSQWSGIIKGAVSIDVPNLTAGTGTSLSVTVTGATTGSAVSVSPTSTLNNGLVIAWSRVSATNTVQIRFENTGTLSVNPAAQTFNIRIIQ